MGRKKKNKTEPVVSSTDEEKEEIVKETSVIEFACPMCKKMLEMKNELEIQKKGNCKCSCIPTSFKISKNDKKMNNIDKTKHSINLETDVHNIATRFGSAHCRSPGHLTDMRIASFCGKLLPCRSC